MSKAESRKRCLAQMKADPCDPRHGTITGYTYGCKCDRCRAASKARIRKREREEKRRDGKTLYAIYIGDEFVDVGTAEELAERHGVKEVTVRTQSAPSLRERAQARGGIEYVRLEGEDD